MTQTVVSVVLFLVILALLPPAVRWFQQRAPGGASNAAASRIVSSLAVGPQQRVVTVEVGPDGARTWLVLGVTAQAITCLHSMPAGSSPARSVFAPPAGKPSADGEDAA
jgi:flagellar protein FliO/FliZ